MILLTINYYWWTILALLFSYVYLSMLWRIIVAIRRKKYGYLKLQLRTLLILVIVTIVFFVLPSIFLK